MDITKAYHQIVLADNSRKYTAFPTNQGLKQYKRMPFGLVTACASYIRLMRLVLKNIPNVLSYFDNIYIYSDNWSSHLCTLKTVLNRLRENGLTARPCKCNLGYFEIVYLGFKVGKNQITPQVDKIEALLKCSPPKTKKTVKKFSRYQ